MRSKYSHKRDEIEGTARWWARTAVQFIFRKTRRDLAVEPRGHKLILKYSKFYRRVFSAQWASLISEVPLDPQAASR